MKKTILLVLLGAVGYHLAANANDREQLVYTVKSTVTNSADFIAGTVRPSFIDQVKHY
jgi:hypothetical protein